jgi:RNA polymerase sigma factor (sigma-70 family)
MDRDDVEAADVLALWRRCCEGDGERDWEALFARVHARLRRLVRRHLWRASDDVPRREDVEELTQEVYCRLLGNDRRALRACRARTTGELWCYLDRVCASVVVDRHRARHALKRRGAPAGAGGTKQSEPDSTLQDPQWCPDERLRRARAREHILATCEALASCPVVASRNVFIVESVVFEGRTIDEVATRVGMRKSGVSSVLTRLRRRLEGAFATALEAAPGLALGSPAGVAGPGSIA